eukprot:jgi/Tetstr1/426991/TSEL_017198.t1
MATTRATTTTMRRHHVSISTTCNNRINPDMLQRQQRWTNQGGNDGMQRHQQPVGFVSPAGHQSQGHQQATHNSNQRPIGHHEACPFVGVAPWAQHHGSLPVMLTCRIAAPGGAATGAHEGEGEDNAEDDLHDLWHVPCSDFDDDIDVSLVSSLGRLAGRSSRTIGECAQAMLLHAGLDCTFWDWVYLHAVYLCNRQWSSSGNAIPYTPMTGRKPDLTDLHVFGCVAWVYIPAPMRGVKGKMTPKSWPCIYVGHHEDTAGYRIYNPATRRETVTRDVIFDEVKQPFSITPALSMPVFQFPDDDHLLDEPQPSDQQEGPHAPPSMSPSAALASAQEGPPPPHHNEQYLRRHLEGDATAQPAPHFSGSAQLPSPYVDLSDYHPTLVASAIAEFVDPYSAQMAALALPAPIVRVSKAPRNYKEAVSNNHPDDKKQSLDREIASITKMETFVWISVPELRRNNPSAIIIQTAWAFAENHDKEGSLITRKARTVVRGDQLTAGKNYAHIKTYAPVVNFIALRTTIALAVRLDWELYQFDVTCAKGMVLRFSSFLRDFGFITSEGDPGVWTLLAAAGFLLGILCVYVDDIMLATSPSPNIHERLHTSLVTTFDATTDSLCTWLLGMAIDRTPGGVIHLHQETYINDILSTFNMTECKTRRLPCTPDTDFHDPTDIAFVVGRLCAYMASPTERHWQIAMSVLRYLKVQLSHHHGDNDYLSSIAHGS